MPRSRWALVPTSIGCDTRRTQLLPQYWPVRQRANPNVGRKLDLGPSRRYCQKREESRKVGGPAGDGNHKSPLLLDVGQWPRHGPFLGRRLTREMLLVSSAGHSANCPVSATKTPHFPDRSWQRWRSGRPPQKPATSFACFNPFSLFFALESRNEWPCVRRVRQKCSSSTICARTAAQHSIRSPYLPNICKKTRFAPHWLLCRRDLLRIA